MPRNITVTFEDGTTHVYQNAPDNVSPQQVSQRAQQEFGKSVKALDGGRKAKPAAPKAQPRGSVGNELLKSARNVAGDMAIGAAWLPDVVASGGNLVERGLTIGAATLGEPVLRGLGADGMADSLRDNAEDAYAGRGRYKNVTMSDMIERGMPTPAENRPARFGAQLLGGALTPIPTPAPKVRPTAPRPVAKPVASPARQVVDAGSRNGVRVMTSDLKPPKTAIGRAGQKLGEMIPFAGTAGNRAAQQAERQAAVEGFAREFGAADGVIDDVTKSLVSTRSAQISNLTKAKRTVIEGLDGAEVPMMNTITALDQKIAELSARGTDQSAAVVGELQRIRSQISGKTLPQVEALRADELSGIFKRNDIAHIRDLGEKALRPVYTALNEDMGTFIKQSGGQDAFLKWKGANTKLSVLAGELKGNQLAGVLKTADATPENVARILFSSKPSEVRRLYSNLSSAGRAKAQSAIVFRAVEKAGGFKELSPDKFLNAMEDLSKSSGVFFQGGDKARLEGLTRLLDATRRAGQAGVMPNNGSQVVPYAIPAVLTQLFGLQGGITVAGLAGGAARVYESAPVRDTLLKLGRSKQGTKAEAIYLERVGLALAAALEGQSSRIASAANENTAARLVASQPQQEQEQQTPTQ